MKTFKQRVVDLIDKSKLDSVKESCSGIFATTLSDNDPSLRRIIIENLEKIKQHNALVPEFLRIEEKIDKYNDIGISEALNDILKPEIVGSNPMLGTALNSIKATYDNKLQPATYIIEQLLNTVKPFEYLPQVDKHIKSITTFIKENNEELSLLRGRIILQKSRNAELYKDVLEKIEEYVYLNGITRNELMNEMTKYQFEPVVRELITVLQKASGNKDNFILKENSKFAIKPINSFIFVNEDKSRTFAHNGVFFNISNNKFEVLSEEKYNQLPEDYILISNYLNSGKLFINEHTVHIKLGNEKISFKQQADGLNKAYLNEKEITTNEPRAFLTQSGLFNGYMSDLGIVSKIWENLNTLISIDFGKEIQSTTFTGLSATLFKLNEEYYVHLRNPAMNVNDIKEGTCLQIKNTILEHMGYDISETLYEFLEGDEAQIAKLRTTQLEIQKAIEELNEQYKKIDIIKEKNLLPIHKLEESGVIKAIDEQVEALKGKYNEITVTINKLQSTKDTSFEPDHNITGGKTFTPKFTPSKSFHPKYNADKDVQNKLQKNIGKSKDDFPIAEADVESIVKDDGTLKVNDQVKVKSSGIVAKVTGINGVTGQVSLLTDEGETLQLPKESLEIIKDKLADQLGDIEKVAKKASDEAKGKMAENFKSFDVKNEKGGNKFTIKPKVKESDPNTKEDIIQLAKKAISVIKNNK